MSWAKPSDEFPDMQMDLKFHLPTRLVVRLTKPDRLTREAFGSLEPGFPPSRAGHEESIYCPVLALLLLLQPGPPSRLRQQQQRVKCHADTDLVTGHLVRPPTRVLGFGSHQALDKGVVPVDGALHGVACDSGSAMKHDAKCLIVSPRLPHTDTKKTCSIMLSVRTRSLRPSGCSRKMAFPLV
jgi:hypothetical protein